LLGRSKAAARTKLARPGGKCWSKLFDGKMGTECPLLGSGGYCSSCKCGLWAREAYWWWCEWWSWLGEGSSSHEAGTSGRECWSKSFGGQTGIEHTPLGSGVWCSSCECGLWGCTCCGVSGGAVAEVKAAASTRLACPVRKCWSNCSKGRRAQNARCLAVECGARHVSVASGRERRTGCGEWWSWLR
jgi:hypothetical protein